MRIRTPVFSRITSPMRQKFTTQWRRPDVRESAKFGSKAAWLLRKEQRGHRRPATSVAVVLVSSSPTDRLLFCHFNTQDEHLRRAPALFPGDREWGLTAAAKTPSTGRHAVDCRIHLKAEIEIAINNILG